MFNYVSRAVHSGWRPLVRHSRRSIATGPSTSRAPTIGLLSLTIAGSALAGAGLTMACQSENSNSTKSVVHVNELDSPIYADAPAVAKAITQITQLVGVDNITKSPGELENHSKDSSNFVPATQDERPYCIVYPQSTEQVSEIAKICYEFKVPMIPYSGGTAIEGHFIPTKKGVCIDFSKMNRIIKLHEDDLDVVVQPGVEWQELGEFLSPYGLLFGPDPGPGAMIGGMVATNCSGTNASRYGTMKENVISLKVVLADGTIIKTKNRPRKSSNGYNLTGLFVGSEGTLGIITEITLKLHVKPEKEVIVLANFEDIRNATKTVSDIFRKGITVNAVELMDEKQMTAIFEMDTGGDRKYAPHNLLLFKLGGTTDNQIKDSVQIVKELSLKNKGFNFEIASSEEDKEEIWRTRKTLLWNSLNWAKKRMPNAGILPTDVAVPVSKLPEIIGDTMIEIEHEGLIGTAAGHAGDGNVHVLIIYPPEKDSQAKKIIANMCKRAIELEGTVSGEHGIGMGKRDVLEMELGSETIAAMRKLKMAWDPLRLLNPDKIFKIDPHDHRDV